MHQFISIIIFFILIFFLLLIVVRRKVTEKLYQPNRRHKSNLQLSDQVYRDIYLSVRTGRYYYHDKEASMPINPEKKNYINIWYFNKYKDTKTILYFHGNRYNISYREYMVKICDCLKVNLLLVDYRGYGKSGGKASSENVLRDAEAAYNFLTHQCRPRNIVVWGESLGGTPACWVASKAKNIGGLILLSTFTSLHAMLENPPNALHKMLYTIARAVTTDIDVYTNNLEMMKTVYCPVIIYHSVNDQLISYSNATQLIEAANKSKKKRLIPIQGGHETPQFTPEKFSQILYILEIDPTTLPPGTMDQIMKIVSEISFASREGSREE